MSDSPEACEEGFYWVILGQNPRKSLIGSAANGGWRVMPSRGSPRRQPSSAIASYSGRG